MSRDSFIVRRLVTGKQGIEIGWGVISPRDVVYSFISEIDAIAWAARKNDELNAALVDEPMIVEVRV